MTPSPSTSTYSGLPAAANRLATPFANSTAVSTPAPPAMLGVSDVIAGPSSVPSRDEGRWAGPQSASQAPGQSGLPATGFAHLLSQPLSTPAGGTSSGSAIAYGQTQAVQPPSGLPLGDSLTMSAAAAAAGEADRRYGADASAQAPPQAVSQAWGAHGSVRQPELWMGCAENLTPASSLAFEEDAAWSSAFSDVLPLIYCKDLFLAKMCSLQRCISCKDVLSVNL